MPAACNKADLITVTQKRYAKLRKLIDPISDVQALQKRDDDTSIKDMVGHRAHWIALFLCWYTNGRAGKKVAFPAPGYKWSQLKAFNATIRAAQDDLDWDESRALLAQRHTALMAFLSARDDAALYSGPMKGAHNNWTTGRWAEAAGAAHYRSAAKWIRACLRADAAAAQEARQKMGLHSGRGKG